MIRFDVLTLFPEVVNPYFSSSIIKRAVDNGLIEIHVHDFREYAGNKHMTVDDYAYSGGAGMLIRVDPIVRCLKDIPGYEKAHKILTSPSGKVYKQAKAKELADYDHIIIICGHYEGIDARILNYVDEEISIGDYVLTGGEIPACIIVDSVSRMVKGVLSDDSTLKESFEDNLLEYPQYTRPYSFEGLDVPDVLISGHHENIRKWQHYESLKKTYLVRPDLIDYDSLSKEDKELLEKIKNEED